MQDPKKQNEKDDSQTETEESHEQASIRQMLSGCTLADYLFTSLGIVVILFVAFCWPVFNIIFGKVVDIFVEFEHDHKNATIVASHEDFVGHFMAQVFFWSGLCLACGAWYVLGNFTTIFLFQMFALRRMRIIKKQYLTSILRQEIAWFDKQNAGEFASRISSDFKKFEAGINENLAMLIYHYTTTMISFATGIYYGWKLSLAVLAVVPLYSASTLIASKLQGRFSSKEMEANSEASSVAEEAISAIRTVFAFGGQEKEKNRYESKVRPAMKAGCKRNLISALESSASWASMYLGLAIGVFYGVKLMLDDGYSVGDVVIIYWSINFCGYSIGLASPHLESWKLARSAAAGIFKVIERQSAIDSSMEEGERLEDNFKTDIELRNVHFSYPTRSDVPILNGVNLKIKEGETVALVGASGCGKSTIIQLMQRFYDPNAGEVLLDGRNLKQLNPGWLRQQIGVVGQEPVLFDASIEENIRLGSAHMETVSQEDVERAAKEANAHEFISGLPEGYRTYVGDRGTQLSGGQKQRIAIARALISRPRVLLLDEATSALDLQSEHVVQAALDRASQGRTTIIVAHRLSTIINAHRIIVMDAGKILEIGTHSELMSLKSHYYNLYKAQEVSGSGEKTTVVADTAKSESISIETTKSSDVPADGSSLDPAVISKTPHLRLFKLVWDLGPFSFIIAFAAAILYGLATPTYALILGSLVGVFGQSTDAEYLWSQTVKYVIFFVALSAAMFVFNILQISLFGFISGNLTMKLRSLAYSAILEQNIAWFDQSKNSSGALVARLANDAADIQGLTGLRIAMLCQALSTIIASVCIGFFFNWQLSLVALLLMPIVGASAIFASGLYKGQVRADGEVAEASGKVVIEVINAMKTVVSLHKQQFFLDRFSVLLDKHYQTAQSQVFKKAFVIAIAQGVAFFAYAVCYCFGGYLLGRGLLKSGDFFRISESMVFGALVVGRTAVFSSDYTKAKLAAYNIFKLIDSKPKRRAIQVANSQQSRCDGSVVVSNVHFSYPNRADSAVLSGLSFSAQKGQTVALVGASGCGKSTTIQLLEQFYEYSGEISLDGKDVAKLDVDWVRRQLALVQQEPILFSYSIRENIAYGDNSREVPFEEIVKAAQMANVHEFVAKLPQGYETPVGGKGAQLSGGQKQRIAIARSLVRDPPVLLLDEATSALDTASEKVVQAALDEAAKGRTCLVIAHRLKTIVNAHKIVVLDGGRNVEEGTHEELLARKGHYWRLYNSAIAS